MSITTRALISRSLSGTRPPFMPTGVALMMTSKASFLSAERPMNRARACLASRFPAPAVRFMM